MIGVQQLGLVQQGERLLEVAAFQRGLGLTGFAGGLLPAVIGLAGSAAGSSWARCSRTSGWAEI